MEKDIKIFGKGLNTDSTELMQPEGTHRFALNAVLDVRDDTLSNEKSNAIYSAIKEDFVLIGSVYIGDGQVCLFSVKKDNSVSEIGILHLEETHKDSCVNNYCTIFNDEVANNKIGFNVNKQIQATYRLVRGCEKTVYWVDDNSTVKTANLSEPYKYFKDGLLEPNLFNLTKRITKIPTLKNIEVLDTGGSIPIGSLKIGIQYADQDKNFTKLVYESAPIIIYEDSLHKPYSEIDGSLNTPNKEYFAISTKSVKFNVHNIDENFPFYRLVFFHFNSNTKTISETFVTDIIPIEQQTYLYTGKTNNKIPNEELSFFKNNFFVERAKTITQKDNRLIIGNTTGLSLNWAEFQRFASKVHIDCMVKKVPLNNQYDLHNAKNPLHNLYGTGFRPGEIRSFGISYLLDNGEESPVFHIPGTFDGRIKIAPDTAEYKTFAMSEDNIAENITYIQRESCEGLDFWGKSFTGVSLKNKKVRFHRFPTRERLKAPLVEKEGNIAEQPKRTLISATFNAAKLSENYCKDNTTPDTYYCAENTANTFSIRFYKTNSPTDYVEITSTDNILAETITVKEKKGLSSIPLPYKVQKLYHVATYTGVLKNNDVPDEYNYTIKRNPFNLQTDSKGALQVTSGLLEEKKVEGNKITVNIYKVYEHILEDSNLFGVFGFFTYSYSTEAFEFNMTMAEYTDTATEGELLYTNILGIKLSNIEYPIFDGVTVIGHKIYSQEVKDKDKTILDSGYVLPLVKTERFHVNSLINPSFNNGDMRMDSSPEGYSKKTFSILSPRYMFLKDTYPTFSKIVTRKVYEVDKEATSAFYVQNVLDYQTPNVDKEGNYTNQDDGTDLKVVIKGTFLKESNKNLSSFTFNSNEVELYDLQPINYAETDASEIIVNGDMLNSSLIAYSKNKKVDIKRDMIAGKPYYPYVDIIREHKTYYEDFQTASYIDITDNEDNTISFRGGNYVGAIRHTNILSGSASGKSACINGGVFKIVLGALLAAAGAVLSVLSLGTLAIVGGSLIAIGIGFLGVKAAINLANLKKVLSQFWGEGLDKSVVDDLYYRVFINSNVRHEQLAYSDDTIKHYGQVLGDLFFDTDININLRVQNAEDKKNYLRPYQSFMVHKPLKTTPATRRSSNTNAGRHAKGVEYTIAVSLLIDGGDRCDGWFLGSKGLGVPIETKEELYFLDKLCTYKRERLLSGTSENVVSGYLYRGVPTTNEYVLNQDYSTTYTALNNYILPLDYSLCSECREEFPQRFWWSEVSQAESLSDNYTNFLPNNYKDLSGENGSITNIFTFNSNLYIHTTEGLWVQPTNYQERITDGIVSYIGTGEFGSLPAQLIVDDSTGNSAGLQHREAQIITPYGYFFINEQEGKIYKFDGKLKPISSVENDKFFKKNIKLYLQNYSLKNTGKNYLGDDTPSNAFGCGFILVYDKELERIIITKKDFVIKDNQNSLLLPYNNKLYIARNYKEYIQNKKENEGYSLVNIVGNTFVFEKTIVETKNHNVFIDITDDPENEELRYNPTERTYEQYTKQRHTVTFAEEIQPSDLYANSWTISYSLMAEKWVSFHSYEPNHYIRTNLSLLSWKNSDRNIYKHNIENKYQEFYGNKYPTIIEYVSNNDPILTKIFNYIKFASTATKYDENTDEIVDVNKTFNKAVVYNSKQCSGEILLKIKNDSDKRWYLQNQSREIFSTATLDRNERDWSFNDFRDIREDYDKPIWIKDVEYLRKNSVIGFVDKILNVSTLNENKDWRKKERMRDKFLVVRLQFDNEEDIKLVFDYAINDNKNSIR